MFLLELLASPVTLPIKGLVWVADKISQQAEDQLYDEGRIRGQLMEAELQLDLGELTEQEFEVLEDELLQRLRIARERHAEKPRG